VEEHQETEDGLVPEEEIRPRTTGLFCFLNSDRVCGAECMAFVTHPRMASSSEMNAQQQHCVLLTSAERVGRNVTAIASMQASSLKKTRIDKADQQREGQFQEPIQQAQRSPFGGKDAG
jgi:hypothetical protein